MESARVFEPAKSKYLVITADYLIPILLSLLVVWLFYLVSFSSFFQVKNISCSIDFGECSDPSVLAELDKLKGQNIIRLNGSSLKSKLTSGDFTIRDVTIEKTLPDSLTVSLDSVYPIVALKVAGDPSWVVLDTAYRVIGKREQDPNVPTIVVNTALTLAIGKPITDPLILSTLHLVTTLKEELPQVKTITLVDSNTIHLGLDNKIIAIISPKLDEKKQIRALQTVLSGGTITSGVRTIDVRFNQPVLR